MANLISTEVTGTLDVTSTVTAPTFVGNLTGTASSATTADKIDGVAFRNTGSNAGMNADTIASNGITYYTSGVSNFSGNATDGALYSQAYSSSWQHQIAGDYRSGQIALRGKNNGTWQAWRTVIDTSNWSSVITLATLGYTGATNANYITNNNQLTNGAGYALASTLGSLALEDTVTMSEVVGLVTALGNKLDASAKAVDSNLLDGLDLHTGRNNEANKVVRTDGNGYLNTGWINTTSGNTTSTITDFYVNTNDGYIRKATPAHVKSQLGLGSAAYVATSTFAAAAHTHDDRYYTETEIDTKLAAKQDTIKKYSVDLNPPGATIPLYVKLGQITAVGDGVIFKVKGNTYSDGYLPYEGLIEFYRHNNSGQADKTEVAFSASNFTQNIKAYVTDDGSIYFGGAPIGPEAIGSYFEWEIEQTTGSPTLYTSSFTVIDENQIPQPRVSVVVNSWHTWNSGDTSSNYQSNKFAGLFSGVSIQSDGLTCIGESAFMSNLYAFDNLIVTNDTTLGGYLTIKGSGSRGTYTGASQYHTGADNIVLKGNAVGISGIFFESEKDGTNINHPSDFGFIQYHAYGTSTSGEANELIIGVSNDADDHLVFNAPDVNGLKFRVGADATDYTVWHSGNFTPSAYLTTSGKAADSNKLDGIDSSSFLRSDADDTLTQTLVVDQTSSGSISYKHSGGVYVPRPNGGSYSTTGSAHTGAIAVKLPTASWGDSDMLSFWVDIFDYAGGTVGESVSLYIYGYQYGTTEWTNCGAVILSDRTDRDYTVRFGHDGTRPIVWIGETGSTWNYLQISVRDFQAGYSGDDWDRYDDGWAIGVNVTSFGTVTDTSTANYPVSKYAATAGSAAAVAWDDVTSKPATFTPSSHTHVAADITDAGDIFVKGIVNVSVNNDTLTFTANNGTTFDRSISDANTWRPIDDTPVNNEVNQSISSNWAYNHVNASNPHGTTAADVGLGNLSNNGNDLAGNFTATGDITAFSDARVKENVETLSNALEMVESMRGVTYNKIGEEKESIGVIAQEVEEIAPQLVHTHEDGMKSVAYGNITAVLIEAIKEQQKQINELKEKLDGFTK
jgi:hypothetical protein